MLLLFVSLGLFKVLDLERFLHFQFSFVSFCEKFVDLHLWILRVRNRQIETELFVGLTEASSAIEYWTGIWPALGVGVNHTVFVIDMAAAERYCFFSTGHRELAIVAESVWLKGMQPFVLLSEIGQSCT